MGAKIFSCTLKKRDFDEFSKFLQEGQANSRKLLDASRVPGRFLEALRMILKFRQCSEKIVFFMKILRFFTSLIEFCDRFARIVVLGL